MFRSTITSTHNSETFNTEEEFINAIHDCCATDWPARYHIFLNDGKIFNRTWTLTSPNTLVVITNWQSEAAYNEYYANISTDQTTMLTAGIVRVPITEEV